MNTILRTLNKQKYAFFFILPAFVLFLLFVLGPFLEAIRLGSYEYTIGKKEFIGFENYTNLLADPIFRKTLVNNILYIVFVVPTSLFLSLAISLAIYKRGVVIKSAVRAVFYLPAIVPSVCMAVVWKWLYNPSYGLFNILIQFFGGGEVKFLGDPKIAIYSVMVIVVTWTIGQPIILFTASLGSVPETILEAAEIDGANSWQKFWQVTWAMIRPTTLYIMVTLTINVMQVVESIMLTTNGGPYYATNSLLLMVYTEAFELNNYGYAAAIGNVMFVVVFIISIIQFKYLSPDGES